MLTVRNLVVRLPGGAEAVRGADFHIAPGERLALVGESGSGKTLTARAILRLLPPGAYATGAIAWHGSELAALSPAAMNRIRGRHIAMVFQEPAAALNGVLRVGTQLVDVIARHRDVTRKAARELAVEMLARCRIPAPERRLHDYPHQLSGGMCQRVMIAMAMACKPELLIADEPTTSLDMTTQAQVLDCLIEMTQSAGSALLLITHDLAVVAETCERALVMRAGRVVESAPVKEMFANPGHAYTRALLDAMPRMVRNP